MLKRRLISNFDTILRGKLYLFGTRSVWRYLIGSIILGYTNPILSIGNFYSVIVYFLGILIIVLPLIVVSALLLVKIMNFDADVEFSDQAIIIRHRNKDLVETKDWSWVKKIVDRKNRIWLIINSRRPFVISLPKNKLSGEEIQFLRSKMQ